MPNDLAALSERLVFSQSIRLRDFFWLSLRNGLFNLVTLTLYRFWGKTEVRRRVWNRVHLNGEPFEYTGRGVELFLGFLFALGAVGLPFLLAVFGAQLLGPIVGGLIILPIYLLFFILVGFGRFTAFRYMASRTSWRGVRLRLTGAPWSYAFTWLGFALLSGVTLGWFWPEAQRRLAAPLWDGLRFGDRRFRFSLDGACKEKVYGAYGIGWIVAAGGYVIMTLLLAAVLVTQARANGGAPREPDAAVIGLFYLLAAVGAVVYAVAFSPYHAAALRSVAAGVSLDEDGPERGPASAAAVGFRLRLKWTDMAWMSLSNMALVVFSLGFFMPLAQARVSRLLVDRLEAEGQVDFSRIRQAADTGPRTGEGLADAFGLAPI